MLPSLRVVCSRCNETKKPRLAIAGCSSHSKHAALLLKREHANLETVSLSECTAVNNQG